MYIKFFTLPFSPHMQAIRTQIFDKKVFREFDTEIMKKLRKFQCCSGVVTGGMRGRVPPSPGNFQLFAIVFRHVYECKCGM